MVASCAPNVGQRSSRRTGPNGNMSCRGFVPVQNWGVYICLGQQNRALALEKQYIAKRDHIRTLLRPHGRRGFSKRTSENLCALMVASCAPNVGQRSSRRTGPNGNMSRRGFILLQNWGVYIILAWSDRLPAPVRSPGPPREHGARSERQPWRSLRGGGA
jgi:hypothetical protein